MIIKSVKEPDYRAVDAIVSDAFNQEDEKRLVRLLREAGDAEIELIALEGEAPVGHIMLSRMAAPSLCLGLAPVSVTPHAQSKGVGGQLIRQAVEIARAGPWSAIFVLGEPSYYTRFGFDKAAAAGFQSEYPADYMMGLVLKHAPYQERLNEESRRIIYAPAFSEI